MTKERLVEERQKLLTRIMKINNQLKPNKAMDIKEALKKEYLVKPKGDLRHGCVINVPRCLVGKRVQIMVIRTKGDETNEN